MHSRKWYYSYIIDYCPQLLSHLCDTGLCVSNSNDCPVYNSKGCENNEIRCYHQKNCADKRENCLNSFNCPNSSPILCPDGKCVNDLSKCVEIPSNGYYCSNGLIMNNESICFESLKFNESYPYRCYNGTNVIAPNGPITQSCSPVVVCPYISPILCSDGECVENSNQCDITNINFINDLNQNRLCPEKSPIMCPDGACVSTIAECYTFLCKNPLFPYKCANGICASEPKLCKTKSISVENKYLCSDGTWRSTGEYCPVIPSCPKSHPVRCGDGKCYEYKMNVCNGINIVREDENCIICPDGICRDVCPEYNGCNVNERLCPDGSCININDIKSNCLGIYPCKEDEYHCGYGVCVKNEWKCPNYHLNGRTMTNVLVRTGSYLKTSVTLVDDEGNYFGYLLLDHCIIIYIINIAYGLGIYGLSFVQITGKSSISKLKSPIHDDGTYILCPTYY